MPDEPREPLRTDRGDRTTDITWSLVRAYWPIIVAFVLIIWSIGESRFTIQAHEAKIAVFEELLNREAFTKYAIDKTNTERDIQELRKDLGRMEKEWERERNRFDDLVNRDRKP